MSIVFDFANIAARMNHKPEPVKVEPVIACGTTHTLTIAQLPSHGHTVTDPGHTHTCGSVGITRISNPYWMNHGNDGGAA
jgi:hypothetical protein